MKLLSSMLCLCVVPAGLAAQTLRGSPASVDLMYTSAHEKDLAFLHSRGDIYQAAVEGDLSLLNVNEDVSLERVTFPFVLPSTRDFVDSLGAKYRDACGERIAVTSGARPIDEQPRNASPKSVHPTGMAVDFRRPANGTCLTWLRSSLIDLEKRGVVEATEEHHPAHFHVAVLHQQVPKPRRVIASAAPSISTNATTASVPTKTTTAESNGEVTSKPASSKEAASKKEETRSTGTSYTVRAGDNLWGIARKHGTTPERIQKLNGLKSSRLRVKQVLKLP
jgi:LysM repeat protein